MKSSMGNVSAMDAIEEVKTIANEAVESITAGSPKAHIMLSGIQQEAGQQRYKAILSVMGSAEEVGEIAAHLILTLLKNPSIRPYIMLALVEKVAELRAEELLRYNASAPDPDPDPEEGQEPPDGVILN